MTPVQNLKITTKGNLPIELAELHQWGTYAGLLDGGPNHELNERLLDEITREPHGIPVHLVRPKSARLSLPTRSPTSTSTVRPSAHTCSCRGTSARASSTKACSGCGSSGSKTAEFRRSTLRFVGS